MTSLDDDLLPAVSDLLAELGKAMIIEEVSKTGDPTTGTVTEGTPTNHSVLGIPPYEVTQGYIDGDVIQAGMLMTGVKGQSLGFTPVAGMKLTFDSETWEIVKVSPVYSGESVCLWLLFLNN